LLTFGHREYRWREKPVNRMHLWVGLLLILVGSLVYVTARPPASVPRLLSAPSIFFETLPAPSYFVYSLPTLAHTAAFILFTTAVLNCRLQCAAVVCAVWLLVEVLFEIGQHPALSTPFAALVPNWLERVPGFHDTRNYFVRGRYDPLDLSAAALGAVLAFSIISIEQRANR
jgi:hypothetical protein